MHFYCNRSFWLIVVCFYCSQCNSSAVCESLKGFFCDLQTAWWLVLSMKPWSYIWLEFGLIWTIIYIQIYIYIKPMLQNWSVPCFSPLDMFELFLCRQPHTEWRGDLSLEYCLHNLWDNWWLHCLTSMYQFIHVTCYHTVQFHICSL